MYKPLIYLSDHSTRYELEYQKRYNDYASVHLPFRIQAHNHDESYEAFYVNHASLDALNDALYQNSKTICALTHSLPEYAIKESIKYFIANEIISTNRIEGIPIDLNEIYQETGKARDYVKMYDFLHNPHLLRLNTPEDIRFIYNELIYNESDPTTFVDGGLFRSHSVYIRSNRGEILHKGLEPESNIHAYLATLLRFLNHFDSAKLNKIAVAHYMFGYIHPFYDGNGRTSRYISSLLLSRELDLFTALSLSQSIERHRDKYYDSFGLSNHPHNKGELTFFCMHFLQFIENAQKNIINELVLSQYKLKKLDTVLSTMNLPRLKAALVLRIIGSNFIMGIPNRKITKPELQEYAKLPHRTLSAIVKELSMLNLVTYGNKKPYPITLSDYLQGLLET
ncbi:Fic family protein [Cohnella panacarvi]|uniref:Fic family protein n=1 Tax=Cohnella panacarvi TaxID=400776 RepID=UPI00047AF2FC|nr:Fic family protein [Cohnella panacarvi]